MCQFNLPVTYAAFDVIVIPMRLFAVTILLILYIWKFTPYFLLDFWKKLLFNHCNKLSLIVLVFKTKVIVNFTGIQKTPQTQVNLHKIF